MAYRAPRLLSATAQRLRDDLGIAEGARELAAVLRDTEGRGGTSGGRAVEAALDLVNDAMGCTKGGAFGVEVIRGYDNEGGFWQDAIAAYVNTGDTYNPTVVYDVDRMKFYCCSWGDWLENYMHRTGKDVP